MDKNEKPLTLTDLGRFTEEVLLPAVERIFDEKFEEKFEEKFDQKIGGLRKEINEHFEIVDEHLEIIDERLESIENMNGRHYKDIDNVERRTTLLETRVDKLEIVRE